MVILIWLIFLSSLGLTTGKLESVGLLIVPDYIRCTEGNQSLTDDMYRRRLAEYNSLDKSLYFYQEIYRILTECDTDTCNCMSQFYFGTYYNLFFRPGYLKSFQEALRGLKARYKFRPIEEINKDLLNLDSVFNSYLFQTTQPFYNNFTLYNEFSTQNMFFYQETMPCIKAFYDNEGLFTCSLGYTFDDARVLTIKSVNELIEKFYKCVIKEMNKFCVKPALIYFALLFFSNFPDIVQGDLYAYARSITDPLPDLPDGTDSTVTLRPSVWVCFIAVLLQVVFSFVLKR